MNLRLTDEELAFRAAVRAFLTDNLPPSIHRKMVDRRHLDKADVVSWQRILNARGWAVPAWPVEWGGTGWSAMQRLIFFDELHQASAPEPLSFNTNMIGPVLIAFGSEAQKHRFLPRIANLDDWWCQGFSEPGAGSDLASLRTMARREDDHYILNGQKTWTTLAHRADWMFCLVRTATGARKQEGITFLLVDMRSPGLKVRPIHSIDGEHELNEAFFDDVRVPVENRVGEEGMGWSYAKYLLGHERTGIARTGVTKERIQRLKSVAGTVDTGSGPLASDPRFREKVAELEVELKALEITQLRILDNQRHRTDHSPDPAASMLKIKGSELQQRASELMLQAAGPHGVRRLAPDEAPGSDVSWAASAATTNYFWRAFSIFGG
ncbi:MAG: acyl-CoA dehydrogenase family protein, partial [Pigmentiphaga sp.]